MKLPGHHFNSPERARAALTLVGLCLALATGCPQQPTTTADTIAQTLAVVAATTPVADMLVWTRAPDGTFATTWLRGNVAVGADVVATQTELLLMAGERLWLWREALIPLELCACDQPGPGPEPRCRPSGEQTLAPEVTLVDLVTGEELPLFAPAPAGPDAPPQLISQRAEVTPIASLGRFLFVNTREETHLCGANEAPFVERLLAVDLEQGTLTEVLTTDEQRQLDSEERATAFMMIQDDPLLEKRGPEALEVTAIIPGIGPRGLEVSYEFSTSAVLSSEPDHQQVYTRRVLVHGNALPRALAVYSPEAPLLAALQSWSRPSALGGYASIPASDVAAAQLALAFGRAAARRQPPQEAATDAVTATPEVAPLETNDGSASAAGQGAR